MNNDSEHPSLKTFVETRKPNVINLHLGCGGTRWLDFINVDLYPLTGEEQDSSRNGCDPDCLADMRSLGLPDGVVNEIFTSHTIDHFTKWEAIDMFADWYRMLVPGGKCIIEVADFWRCVLWLFHPSKKNRHLARTQFYGNQWDKIEYETHRYVWSAGELKKELLRVGFRRVSISHRTCTHVPGRDMRVIAER